MRTAFAFTAASAVALVYAAISGRILVFFIVAGVALVFAVVMAVRTPARRQGRHAYTDPRDVTDPDGDEYVKELRESLPASQSIDVYGRFIDAPLTRVNLAYASHRPPVPAPPLSPFPEAGLLPPVPDDPPPDETVRVAWAINELGAPVDEYVEEVFAKHAADEEPAAEEQAA